ncbi:MAG: serine/threonine protein kinase, partial [Planctomycetes bacterium]|nr:serine/threonine protein kinase [Planctomycetota bacterium]
MSSELPPDGFDAGLPRPAAESLDSVIETWLEAEEAGRAPPPESLVARHPEFAEPLRRFFRMHLRFARSDGALRPQPSPDRSPPMEVAGYRILREIARGGMGIVYEARQPQLDRTVALKMILAGALADRDDIERFRREAHAIARLDHPHIVPILEVGEEQGLPFLTMKYLPGGTLADHRDRYRDPHAAASLLEKLARAVHAVHEVGIVHRDLKPGNILFDIRGEPLLSDFGLAKLEGHDATLTQTGSRLGTPSYMAPEQIRGRASGGAIAVDIYSLGAVLYELLSGHPPFVAESALELLRRVQEEPPSRLRRRDGLAVPKDLETVCLKCLEKDPRRRYSTAQELADDLRRFREGRAIAARAVSAVERLVRWGRRNPTAVVIVVLLTLVASGAVLSWLEIRDSLTSRLRADRASHERLLDALEAEAQAWLVSGRDGQRTRSLDALVTVAAERRSPRVRDAIVA